MENRIHQLIEQLKKNDLDSVFLTSIANVFYVSNFYTNPHERLVAVYIDQTNDPLLIVPAMEMNDAKNAGWKYQMIGYHDHENVWELIFNHLKNDDKLPSTIGVEYAHLNVERFHALKDIFPHIELKNVTNILNHLHVIKSKQEYTLLKQAASLADFGIKTGVEAIREGISELEIVAKIEYKLKKQGVQQMSFATTVITGAKTASPHGVPDKTTIDKGDLVLFDLGVVFEGYCSDITRTVAFHSVTEEQEKIYETVLTAEEKAITAVEIGRPVGELDKIARDHIATAGYGEYFTHRLGHGIGIDVHEFPSMHGENDLPLAEGMSFTIEPGIYVPNIGGVRIEDMVFVTAKGGETLTSYPKDLQIVT